MHFCSNIFFFQQKYIIKKNLQNTTLKIACKNIKNHFLIKKQKKNRGIYQRNAGQNRTNQSSFNRIDVLLDQTIDDIEQLFNQRFQQQQQYQQQQQLENSQQNSSLPQLLQPNINNQQFNNQLIHQVTSLIKVSIDNQIKKKEECLNQEFKKQFNQIYEKEKIQKQSLEEIIKTKDLQLQSQNLQQIQTQQPIIQSSPQLILKPFTYNNNSIYQDQWCQAIAINKDCQIIIAEQFKQEVLKQTKLLTEHSKDVLTLNFMNKSNHFISGSDDNSILIWSMNQNNMIFQFINQIQIQFKQMVFYGRLEFKVYNQKFQALKLGGA